MISRYDKNNIETLPWPDSVDGRYARSCLRPLITNGAAFYIDNVATDPSVLLADGLVVPLMVNEKEYSNAYVCSIHTHYVSYAIEELRRLRGVGIAPLLEKVLGLLGAFLRARRIDQCVYVNNWLLATNLYPQGFHQHVGEITALLQKAHPEHAVVLRSVNAVTDPALYEALQAQGYMFIPSRKIFMYDPRTRNSIKLKFRTALNRDRRLVNGSGYQWGGAREMSAGDIDRCLELYNKLYLKKYSLCNPWFNGQVIRSILEAVASGESPMFEVRVLKKDGRIDGVLGYFFRNGVMTAPLVGYDTDLSREAGLFRMIHARLAEEAEQKGLLLNMSSGASEFKRTRGGVMQIEYTAVYHRHLAFRRRVAWEVLSFLANGIGLPLLKKG